tara:strand:- start:2916 stop:3056 length:141 start_codon:yes stop_codon:yes gene_type:complete
MRERSQVLDAERAGRPAVQDDELRLAAGDVDGHVQCTHWSTMRYSQ